MKKKVSILAAVFLLVIAVFLWRAYAAQSPQVPLAGGLIPKWVDALPGLHIVDGTLGTPIELQMTEFLTNILPTGYVPPGIPPGGAFNGTYVWGYLEPSQVGVPAAIPSYIGPVVVAGRNTPTEIKFVNNLGTAAGTNVLAWKYSTDQTLHWADPLNIEANTYATMGPGDIPNTTEAQNYDGPVPAVVHLHGGEVPPTLDGGPDAWFLSGPPGSGGVMHGHGYYTKFFTGKVTALPAVPDPAYPEGSVVLFGTTLYTLTFTAPDIWNWIPEVNSNYAIYRYPNKQEPANIWFHDHVLGMTRLNVYAGMAGAYIITESDPNITLPGNLNNPTLIIPLVIQDRMFDTNGQLFFPADTAGGILWSVNPEHPYWVPEFLGDVIVVNGKAWPYLNVEQNRYRFLFLNGSNARTYEMWASDPATGLKPPMWVIGTDGGYLNSPAKINKLTIMPGERYDVIMDFSAIPIGTNLIMMNTARAPFPKGAPPQGATTGQVIQFRVGGAGTATVQPIPFNPAGAIRGGLNQPPLIPRLPGTPGALPITPGTNVQVFRQLTLNEVMQIPQTVNDPVTGQLTPYPGGPLEVLLNNTKWTGERLVGGVMDPIPGYTAVPAAGSTGSIYYSELPAEGDTELWEITNLTADAHPIHLHLVQFQVMDRQNFNFNKYFKQYAGSFPGGVLLEAYGPPMDYYASGVTHAKYNTTVLGGNPDVTPYLQGKAIPPGPEEQGWKDTVISYPAQVLRLVVRWAPTELNSTSFPFNPDSGHGYVWHCHIIDHEDNEMMRPTSVTALPVVRSYVKGVDY